MDWYGAFRPLLFRLNAETAHELSLDLLGAAERLKVLSWMIPEVKNDPVTVAGIEFPNPVGLAAGLDKNGDYIDAMAQLGFGFIEIGTTTPRPQPGNLKPRLFRIPERQAIINRMGFNNKGVDYLVDRVKAARFQGVLGINIGKNFDTPVENAVDDYLICLEKVYPYATYITVNISSPNTPGLRTLQYGDALKELLQPLKERQKVLSESFGYKPIFVKIAPDMNTDEVALVANSLVDCGMDGVIATNTTLDRTGVEGCLHANEQGGLSGAPLEEKATEMLENLTKALDGRIPVIGVGGITDGAGAIDKIKAGAQLVQIYSGFIYRGPELICEAVEAVANSQ
ncbi:MULTISPECIES: quinone-dependent dihydroorotate dehydrogenase [unclassified Oceanobacter]|uniref:quinone-dependent dihydroorotate dehydrogenase n=1 Tax=unclassified Oceanobacter TaxID=2620260 RepID=UPI0026E24BBE|nr:MULTISPECIES: quinone-dependent dihydroorotate dehydrogenase [unclassified Oceanobacter]MDO6681726.1 quinone-dependent dihydroorotate dehydrogenase [Oceanobacter sp. 5_MG-2023]MDP2507259.1 quinone-dependent dihydroorotate dehydrogenase [Oceanobacter sp. 3_MG-2023]MDP2549423.1 quinone-dependent dihydroorotate dehydrogenase [Oceanobacter sp. 4_MG-2023]MDP2610142.1 quinone-dependent dihydroorotate dehydrogenase [Oceanobacter sp. 1_MG-2023]MDP2613449.1 quinone-dependent dihydroorotate dehydroge